MEPNPASGIPCAAIYPASGCLTWFLDEAAAADLPSPCPNLGPPAPGPVVGLIGAMPQEISKLRHHVREQREHAVNGFLTVVEGVLPGAGGSPDVSVVFCAAGVGMVAAATAATILIERFKVGKIHLLEKL